MNKEEIINGIIDKAYALICDELSKAGIKHDPSDGCIFADGIGRAAFHWNSCRQTNQGTLIHIDCRKLFI